MTGSPASRSARAVPPVETSSNPRAHQPGSEHGQPGLVRGGQQGASRHREGSLGPGDVDRHPPTPRRDRDGAGEDERDRAWQQAVLHRSDPVVQRLDVIAGQDRHRLLGKDRPAVERLIDEMDGAPGDRHAVRQGVGDGVRAGERRQQRWMGVEDAPGERGEDLRPDDPHVAREHDDIGLDRGEGRRQRRVVTARDQRRLQPEFGGPVERGAGPVGEDQRNPAADLVTVDGGRQRSQIGPGARDPDRDPPGTSGHATPSSGPST